MIDKTGFSVSPWTMVHAASFITTCSRVGVRIEGDRTSKVYPYNFDPYSATNATFYMGNAWNNDAFDGAERIASKLKYVWQIKRFKEAT